MSTSAIAKADVQKVAFTAVGVILAGFLLNMLRGNSLADKARGGFTS